MQTELTGISILNDTMKTKLAQVVLVCGLLSPTVSRAADDGAVLPFPPTPSASIAGRTLAESKHRAASNRRD